jgi:putative glutamine amidotransferase
MGIDPIRLDISARSHWPSDLDGLLLTGGPDINPLRYGRVPEGSTNNYDDERDLAEIEQLESALDRRIPILAICRGMQLLNVVHGGTLFQDLDSGNCHLLKTTVLDQPGKHRPAHLVTVMPGTRLASILKTARLSVNSRHHQAIENLGRGLLVAATAPDGTIEAIEGGDDPFVLGVQWHPEDRILASPCDYELFNAFAKALTKGQI